MAFFLYFEQKFLNKQTVPSQTTFLKLSRMPIKILYFWLWKLIILGEVPSRTCNNAKRRSWKFCTRVCEKKLNPTATLTKLVVILKKAIANLKNLK